MTSVVRITRGPVTSVCLVGFAATILLTACSPTAEREAVHTLSGSTMGTTFSIKLVAPPVSLDLEELKQAIGDVLREIEGSMSTYIPDSEVSRFNQFASRDWFPVTEEVCSVVAAALTLSAATEGAFDVTVGPLVNLWGFGPGGIIDEPPDPAKIALLLEATGYESVHADCARPALRKDIPEAYLDLSGYAKGYGVDRLATLLDAREVARYLVEIGGELRLKGRNPEGRAWAVAIEAPRRGDRGVQGIARLTDVAVATSGDYRNYFVHEDRLYSHTIDPRNGYPIDHGGASVTVVAPSAAYADAMATALLVLGPQAGLEYADAEEVAALFLLRDDGQLAARASGRFAAEVSYQ